MNERSPSTAAIAARTIVQTIVFWGVFLWLIPWGIVVMEGRLGIERWHDGAVLWRTVGVIVFCIASGLGLTSAGIMVVRGRGTPLPLDPARRLVVVGPYRWVRNPMAIAGLAQGIAVSIALGSIGVLIYSLLGGPVWHWLVRPWEEADLSRRFGGDYETYRSTTPLWLPRPRKEVADEPTRP